MDDIKIQTQPWSNFNEWKALYDLLFNNIYKNDTKVKKIEDTLDSFIYNLNLESLKSARHTLSIWSIRGDNTPIVLTTSLLLEEIIKIHENSFYPDIKNTLAQKIIRVTNLIIDDLKKKNKSLKFNMFLIAKKINFPEFIIEVRHTCTHKNLPNLETLLFVIKFLYFWLKENIWDKQYHIFNLEKEISQKIGDVLSEMRIIHENTNKNKKIKYDIDNKLNEIENLFKDDNNFNLELDNLIPIIERFCILFLTACENDEKQNDKSLNVRKGLNLLEFNKIFKFLYNIEQDLIVVLIFKYISQQLNYLFKNYFTQEYNSENELDSTLLKNLAMLSKYMVKSCNKNIDIKKLKIKNIVRKIYLHFSFLKDFNKSVMEIFESFSLIFKNINEFSTNQFSKSQINEESIDINTQEKYQSFNLKNSYPGSLIFNQLNNLIHKTQTTNEMNW